jgi:hypothetical protein
MAITPFKEVQSLPIRRTAIALAIPPLGMTGLLIWQVLLHHPWGKQPMSNGSVIGWTIFLWLIYWRLMTVRLVTEVRGGKLIVGLRGLWRPRRVSLSEVSSAALVTFDPVRDYGGYGIRSNRKEKAYIASGTQGVRIKLKNGSQIVIGSQRARELSAAVKSTGITGT